MSWIFMLVILLLFPAGTTAETKKPVSSPPEDSFFNNIISNKIDRIYTSRQAVLVIGSGLSTVRVIIYTLERGPDGWRVVSGPIKGNIGWNGFAAPGMKREGDGKTPSGIYPLGTVFGYAPSMDTRMPYRQATKDDFWVDAPDSPYYNRWVTGNVGAASFEKMRSDNELYKYGIVVEYNTNPVIKGYGSAIFIHVWRGEGIPTAGCVAMAEEEVLKLIRWLDPEKKPAVIMGNKSELGRLR
ncbi:MAG TPA: L,D-transpeptidase family protein [Geobacteraceae bacterium]|nr:L,D-transpeptidase family protein [Geobacteraceae bacterium]